MKKILLLSIFCLFLTHGVKINAQSHPKGIISGQSFLQSGSDGKVQTINITNFEEEKSVDSIIVNWLLTKEAGPLYANPLAWDVIDSTIYLISLYEDNFGQNFAQLVSYSIIDLKRLYFLNKDSLTNYIISPDNIKSNPLAPLAMYSSMITFKSDTLRGKVYFDLYCNTESLNLYIYLEDIKKLEVWEFTRYPIIQKYINNTEKDKITEIYKQKPWKIVSSQNIEIACPFRVFNINKKDYLIDVSGQSYQLQGTIVEKTNTNPIQNMKNSILIINKNTNDLLLIPESKFSEKSSLSVKDKIAKYSKKIKVNK